MFDLKELIYKLVERENLSANYGHISCFDAPDAYEKMEKIYDEVMDELRKEFSFEKYPSISPVNVFQSLETIALDIHNGNITEPFEVYFLTNDEFLEDRVLEGYRDNTKDIVYSLYYYMDIQDRANWLKNNYLYDYPKGTRYYYDDLVNFVIEVQELWA